MEELVEQFERLSITKRRALLEIVDRRELVVKPHPPYRGGLLGLPAELLNNILLLVSFDSS